MNKISIIILSLAIGAAAYFLLFKKNEAQPESTTITGMLERSSAEELLDEQTAAVAASLISISADNADVFILEPGDGSTVTSPVTVKFGITNMVVAPAGQNVENSGHHHLLINMDELPPLDQPLPATDQLIHFGGAQTETTVKLEPGKHTLQLVLGNYLHIPHDKPVVSKKITINVEASKEAALDGVTEPE